MTVNKGFKRMVRARMVKTGQSYYQARMDVLARMVKTGQSYCQARMDVLAERERDITPCTGCKHTRLDHQDMWSEEEKSGRCYAVSCNCQEFAQ